MQVKDVMKKRVPKISENEKLDKAIEKLTSIAESALPVVNKQKKVVGEINQIDLLLKITGETDLSTEGLDFESIKHVLAAEDNTIKQFVNNHGLTVRANDDIKLVVQIMYDNNISTVPVVDRRGKLLGMVTDIVVLKHYKKILSAKKRKKR